MLTGREAAAGGVAGGGAGPRLRTARLGEQTQKGAAWNLQSAFELAGAAVVGARGRSNCTSTCRTGGDPLRLTHYPLTDAERPWSVRLHELLGGTRSVSLCSNRQTSKSSRLQKIGANKNNREPEGAASLPNDNRGPLLRTRACPPCCGHYAISLGLPAPRSFIICVSGDNAETCA